MAIKMNFDGLLRSPSSWAKVNRELLKALDGRDDVRLGIQPRRGFNWERSFELDERLTSKPDALDDPDVTLTFTFPPLLERDRPAEGRHFLLSLYEATRLPSDWVDPLRSFEGTILVPSKHVEEIYRDNGVSNERLERIPYGYNPDLYHPDPDDPTDPSTINVLSVGTAHYRKGFDYLLGVPDLAARNDVDWRVHSPYRPDDPGDFWEDSRLLDRLEDRGFRLTHETLGEEEMAELYRWADLVVQPSRSEGFGLVILEAMACGTPVVTTNWGGQLDFAGPGMTRVDGATRAAGRAQYHRRRPSARVFDPDPRLLRQHLRRLIDNPDRLREQGKKARRTVENWTWNRTARQLVERVNESPSDP